ncbi:hypothetical protein ACFL2V_11030 [Pseudomonadota bacterium]
MKHHTETLISVGIVVFAITVSILKDEDNDTSPNTQNHATTHSPAPTVTPAIQQTPTQVTPQNIEPLTADMSLTEKKQRCEKNSTQANQAIKESLDLIKSLNPENKNERRVIDQHMARISIAKSRLEECQTLIQDYEQKIESLENKIKTLQESA